MLQMSFCFLAGTLLGIVVGELATRLRVFVSGREILARAFRDPDRRRARVGFAGLMKNKAKKFRQCSGLGFSTLPKKSQNRAETGRKPPRNVEKSAAPAWAPA